MERDAVQATPPTVPGEPALPSGPAAAGAKEGRRGTGRRRLVLVAAVVGLVALLGAGAGGYAIARDSKLGEQTASCGNSRCFPGITPAMVVEALTRKGFACEEERRGDWTCRLTIAGAEFRAYVESYEGLISDFSGSVHPGYEDEVPAMTRSFLGWLGSIPVAHDPVLAGEVRGWLDQHFEGGAEARATIGHYRYELNAEEKANIDLRVWVEE
ncbi:hypothetical protein [Micromonospora rubida]|uniref:hypothetical protein n=1 Tax=Micromonospora rubida TaxID=2697657 RepID=UPI001376EC43|nr:hypothetical protein [Micromonospora rubida]NBE79569.1 hypothetical protein [Micromonospora rubida]